MLLSFFKKNTSSAPAELIRNMKNLICRCTPPKYKCSVDIFITNWTPVSEDELKKCVIPEISAPFNSIIETDWLHMKDNIHHKSTIKGLMCNHKLLECNNDFSEVIRVSKWSYVQKNNLIIIQVIKEFYNHNSNSSEVTQQYNFNVPVNELKSFEEFIRPICVDNYPV